MRRNRNIILSLILLLLFSCGSKESQEDTLTCGTESSPYTLQDMGSDTAIYRLDYWWFLANEGMWADTSAVLKDIEHLNEKFDTALIQFELGEIHEVISPRKFDGQKNYQKHGWEIEEWYWENRDSVPYALFCMVYPPTREGVIFPGAALEIGGQGYCIQSLFLGYSTSVHEMAHVFALYHTHQQDNTDGRTYSTGDMIADIPYHPSLSGLVSKSGGVKRPIEGLSDEELQLLVHNWMSYTIFELRDSFSEDQIDRMRWAAYNYPKISRAKIN